MGAQSNAAKSVLAADLKITGDIRSSGSVELLGEVEGTLQAQSLVIGGDGSMAGDISATEVDVKGQHTGRIATQSLSLRATSQVSADIGYSSLVIESGAQIEGRFTLNKG